jgi:hypothetical protein
MKLSCLILLGLISTASIMKFAITAKATTPSCDETCITKYNQCSAGCAMEYNDCLGAGYGSDFCGRIYSACADLCPKELTTCRNNCSAPSGGNAFGSPRVTPGGSQWPTNGTGFPALDFPSSCPLSRILSAGVVLVEVEPDVFRVYDTIFQKCYDDYRLENNTCTAVYQKSKDLFRGTFQQACDFYLQNIPEGERNCINGTSWVQIGVEDFERGFGECRWWYDGPPN